VALPTDPLVANVAWLLDALADRIAMRLTTRPPETYSSRDLPPRCSRRRFAEISRSGRIDGASREGRDWICTRAAWEAARSRKANGAAPVAVPIEPPSLSARADELLKRAGLRVVRGVR
jgi:hypothetical protein